MALPRVHSCCAQLLRTHGRRARAANASSEDVSPGAASVLRASCAPRDRGTLTRCVLTRCALSCTLSQLQQLQPAVGAQHSQKTLRIRYVNALYGAPALDKVSTRLAALHSALHSESQTTESLYIEQRGLQQKIKELEQTQSGRTSASKELGELATSASKQMQTTSLKTLSRSCAAKPARWSR